MGVRFDGSDGLMGRSAFAGLAGPGRSRSSVRDPADYLLSHSQRRVPRHRPCSPQAKGSSGSRSGEIGATKYQPGTIYIASKPATALNFAQLAARFGLSFDAVASKPQGDAFKLHPPESASGSLRRIDRSATYAGSRAGLRTLRTGLRPGLNAGNLKSKFDVLIFGRHSRRRSAAPRRPGVQPPRKTPEQYRNQLGSITAAQTIPALRRFVEEGGTIVTIGSSTALAQHPNLPSPARSPRPMPRAPPARAEHPLMPGSVLETTVDNIFRRLWPAGKVDVFANSPARLLPTPARTHANQIASYAGARPCAAVGHRETLYLMERRHRRVGCRRGKVYLFAPKSPSRTAHGTFSSFNESALIPSVSLP
jgi:hypothetical protein